MNLKEFQQEQVSITEKVINDVVKLHPEHETNIRSHPWSLDISDMVWECCHCFAVLHAGKRRFMDCHTEGVAHMEAKK